MASVTATVSSEVEDQLVTELLSLLDQEPEFLEKKNIVGSRDRISRFLVSKQYNVTAAKDAIMQHLQWRKDNNVENWRAYISDKPFLLSSLPHGKELRYSGLGMDKCVTYAGKSRLGDVVFLEIMGGDKAQASAVEFNNADQEELVGKMLEYYITFMEKRAMLIDDLSKEQGRRVATVQIRDVSQAFMPKLGAFPVAQKILSAGVNNYPESTSVAIFTNPPAIFSAVFAIIKRWLPEDTHRKFRFLTKADVPKELMRFIFPQTIVALFRLSQGEDGDDIANELNLPLAAVQPWTQSLEVTVSPRDVYYWYYRVDAKNIRTVSWTRKNAGESPKSKVTARLFFTTRSQANLAPEDISVECTSCDETGTSLSLPESDEIEEGLFVLALDHSESWFTPHTFKLDVFGAL